MPTPDNGQTHSNNYLSVSDHFGGLPLKRVNPFHDIGLFIYPLKTSVNQRLWNGLVKAAFIRNTISLPVAICLFKVNNWNTRTRVFKINKKDIRTTPVFIVNFEYIPHLILVFLLLSLSR